MGNLSSRFEMKDLEMLIDSIDDWESMRNQEFHMLNAIKGTPMPPEDHEAFEPFQYLKNMFKQREKEIERNRTMRQEKAVFLKAKLMLARQDMDVNSLFDFASEEEPKVSNNNSETQSSESGSYQKRWESAEEFIKDLGVWSHYETFLSNMEES